jgi:hypothetical protein
MLLWLSIGLAGADELALQPLGQALVGSGWDCPADRDFCTRQGRAASLLGTWTAQLDAQDHVRALTFSVVWTGQDFPVPAAGATAVADPWKEAQAALARLQREHSGWQLLSRADGDPAAVVYTLQGEQRTLAAWTTVLTTEQGRTYTTATLHVQRELPSRP